MLFHFLKNHFELRYRNCDAFCLVFLLVYLYKLSLGNDVTVSYKKKEANLGECHIFNPSPQGLESPLKRIFTPPPKKKTDRRIKNWQLKYLRYFPKIPCIFFIFTHSVADLISLVSTHLPYCQMFCFLKVLQNMDCFKRIPTQVDTKFFSR